MHDDLKELWCEGFNTACDIIINEIQSDTDKMDPNDAIDRDDLLALIEFIKEKKQ